MRAMEPSIARSCGGEGAGMHERRLRDTVAMIARPSEGHRAQTRGGRALTAALVVASALALARCGQTPAPGAGSSRATSVPSYVTEPFTHEQRLIEQGARLVVADGCAACHLAADAQAIAPSFSSFAGHRVTLANGHSVLVDERFLREGLLDPVAAEVKGYDPAPMLAALARLHLDRQPAQLAALAAFIEQVGPEPE